MSDVKTPKGNAIVLPESKSVEAATPTAEDKREGADLARRVGTGLIQLYNAREWMPKDGRTGNAGNDE